MKTALYDKTGTLKLVSDSGKEYYYFGVEQHIYYQVKKLLKRGYIGKALRLLEPYTRRDIYEVFNSK